MFEDKEGCEYTYSAKDFLVDIPGILILHHYLFGNGKDYIIQNNDLWTFYMKGTKICHEFDKCAGESLSDYAYSLVYDYGLDLCNGESLDFDVTTSAEIENGESIKGMHYLHGTNSKVGGFRVYGTVNMEYGYRIYKYTCEWNDIIDPNYQYSSDMAKVNIAYKIPFANPTDYTIKISWNETRVDNINGVSRY